MKRNEYIGLAFVVIAFAIGIYVYPLLPDQVASHWNLAGQVDDYLPRFWGAFLMPLIALAMWLLFLLIPRIDPLKKNIDQFRNQFDGFIILLLIFLLYIYLLTIAWSLGARLDIGLAMTPALAVLFYYIGMILPDTKRNWFMGIRTPWTMSDDRVWEKTHKLASWLFKLAALVVALGFFYQSLMFYFMIGAILTASIVPVIYSYFIYKK